ncbi:MAG: glucose-6-phosphate isomerase [Bacteroidetes bacterium]|nr:glucose-6-phosphate isomerase [Bacteroidota bacterium]
MKDLRLDIENVLPFIEQEELISIQKEIFYQHQQLLSKSGKGSDFLGWIDLPGDISSEEFESLERSAAFLREMSEVVVMIGIGGSYLGARAVIEALTPAFAGFRYHKGNPLIVYAGHQLSEDYMADLMEFLGDKAFSVIVISKSGTTTEPAIAFRLLKQELEKRYGKSGAGDRIIAITDKLRGALKTMADQEGYKSFVIPDDVGGRFSVLTPVGLLPIAVAGFNIRKLVEGAVEMQTVVNSSALFEENPAALYAAVRNLLYRRGKPVEVLVNYESGLSYFTEWWKQLYGESEGKQNRGIFPAGVNFTTDLHSMGQYLQDGLRVLFETVLSVEKPRRKAVVPEEAQNLDGLNFLSGTNLGRINHMAELGTLLAHVDGGVPVMKLIIPEINEYYLGELIYFFEFACALSGYILDVNPFDQPGVEEYKRNMFALLGKAGYERETQELKKRLNW